MSPMRPAILITALVVALVAAAGVFALVRGDGDDTTTTTTPSGAPVAGGDGPSALGDTTTTRPGASESSAPEATSTTRPPRTTPTTTATPPPTAPTPTTTPGVEPNNPPVVTIGPPEPLQRFEAFFNPNTNRFAASVPLVANVTDPEGDAYSVDWFSSMDGYLGTGQSITATLHPDLDVSQPVITARATDATGAVGEFSLQVIVWIRSDE